MRLHLKIKTNKAIVPFDHQHLLVGVIHKWLGQNDLHGKTALFSFSRLEKGRKSETGLEFDNYANMFISAYDTNLLKKLIKGIQSAPEMFNGLVVEDITIEHDPNLSERESFFVASPILLKLKKENKKNTEHLLYSDKRANEILKETIQRKLKIAEIEDDTFDIYFDLDTLYAGTKMINYKGIKNRCNWCNVIIKGKPETKQCIWNIGLGHSTGIGLGAIK